MLTRLKTVIWAHALLRRATVAGAYGLIGRKGDDNAGAAVIIVNTLDGNAVMYTPMQNMDGERVWYPKGPLPARDIDQLAAKRASTDPDLWIIEVEDKQGRHFLTEPVEAK